MSFHFYLALKFLLIPTEKHILSRCEFVTVRCHSVCPSLYRVTQKNGNYWKTQQKLKKSKKKKFIDRNLTITTCLLRDSNPDYQCLKITSCRCRHPPRMHSFTATTHFKSSRSFESPCVCCILCRIRAGTFEMRSGSERMHTWRRTPSTGCNFQTLIIWITVS